MDRSRVLRAAAVLFATAAFFASLSGQSQTPFRAGVDLVQLDVVVLDDNRHPVEGLTAADFTVIDDGKPRPIVAFTPVTLPAPEPVTSAAAWTREVAADVIRNQRPAEGRLVVILFDRSIRVGTQTLTARTIANATVDALGPGDMAAVVHDSGFANEGLAQNFTADKARLRQAIAAPFMGLPGEPEMGPGGLREVIGLPMFTGDCLCGLCTLEALERLGDALAPEPRRQKSVLFIGTDLVIDIPTANSAQLDCSELVRYRREKAMRALDRANVTLHSIDTAGLETAAGPASAMGPSGQSAARRAYVADRQGNLGFFPDYTGGRVVTNTNDPQDLIPQIFEESRAYYLIGFEAADPRPRERRHDVQVRVGRRGVTVRTRKGYYTGEAEPPNSLPPDPASRSVVDLLPVTDVPLSLALTPMFEMDGTTTVTVQVGIEPQADLAAPRGATSDADAPAAGAREGIDTETEGETTRLDVVMAVFDRKARPAGTFTQSLEIPASPAVVLAAGFESLAKLPLPPGDYEIRVGVSGIEARSGSVFGYVEVPDPARDALAVSGVIIGARAREGSDAGQAADDTARAIAPTVRRAFSSADIAGAFLQVRRADGDHLPVTIHARVLDDHDRVVTESTSTLGADAFRSNGIADINIPLPVGRLEAGRYLLAIDAGDGRDNQRRNVRFEAVSDVAR